MLRLALLGQGATSGQLGIGYRGFQFKSDGAFSFSAAAVEGVISRRIAKGSDSGAGAWRLSASYRFEARRFASPVQLAVGCAADPGICGVTPGASDRYDAFQQLQLSARYLGAAQAELSYGFVANSSGSYGEDYQRHACSLGFTAPLWGPLFLSATAVLQLSRFSDSALTAPGLAIEGDPEAENRSRVTIHLAWELSARWSLGLRYAIYLNESGSAAGEQPRPSFLRQTIFMGLRFDYASES